tara:strand:+ start:176 stop:658 length:483 start_codon:yes stop_codon:yes gene_type:complete
MSVTMRLRGGDDFKKILDQLDDKVANQLLAAASRKAAHAYRNDMKRVLPRSDGEKLRTWRVDETGTRSKKRRMRGTVEDVHVRDSLGIKKAKGKQKRAVYQVGVTGLARAYAHVLEFGSKHMQGRRYFTRTLEARANEYLKAMRDEAWKQLVKLARQGKI